MPRPKKNKITPSAQLLAEGPEAPDPGPNPTPHPGTCSATVTKILFDDSDSEVDEFHSALESPPATTATAAVASGTEAQTGFRINEEYARRFEHNKKREELHRCMFSLETQRVFSGGFFSKNNRKIIMKY